MTIERYRRSTRRYHAAVYTITLLLLATGWWLLAGREGAPSPLASVTGVPDVRLHVWLGWALLVAAVLPLLFALRGVATFVRETLRADSGDIDWLVRWPIAIFTGRFRRHEGHFDPGQRLANVAIVALLAVLIATGVGLVLVKAGPAFAFLDAVHRLATIAFTIVIAGHLIVALGVLPGYRGVWRSMHLGGRVRLETARRLWPGWTERAVAATPAADVSTRARPHRVLILGGGFAGIETARHLERLTRSRDDVEIWIVNRENFTLFTPLLPEVSSGMLEAHHAVTAIRAQLRHPSSWAITAEVTAVEADGRVVTVIGGDGTPHRLEYDTLVLALGGETATFGIPGITEYTVGLKTLADAFALRNRLIEMLERADLETDPESRRALLTYIVGGGGFSGVETAGEIEDLVRRLRTRYYPRIRPDELRFVLFELGDHLLSEMGAGMGEYAASRLMRRGYELRLGTPIRAVRPDGIVVGDGEFIASRTVIWTAGVRPARVVREAGVETDEAGRVLVEPTMRTSREDIFALGDVARIPDLATAGKAHAPTAQNAVREGKRLARNILARIDGRAEQMEPFRYRPVGTLASIGHYTGIGVVFGIQLQGLPAWLTWRGYYWSRVPGMAGKLRVAFDWLLGLVFGSDPVQLKVDYPGRAGMGPSGTRRPRQRTTDLRG